MTRDAVDARERLLNAALQVFAEKGYASASTREICKLAEANVAAIHYYFNDKASLYREIFRGAEEFRQKAPQLDDLKMPLRDVLSGFYRHLLQFTNDPRRSQQFRMLFVREQLQPSGVLAALEMEGMTPFHTRLARLVQRRLGAPDADLLIQHLAFSLLGLVLVLFVELEAVQRVAPEMLADERALAATAARLADQGVALVDAEQARRAQTNRTGSKTSSPTSMSLSAETRTPA